MIVFAVITSAIMPLPPSPLPIPAPQSLSIPLQLSLIDEVKKRLERAWVVFIKVRDEHIAVQKRLIEDGWEAELEDSLSIEVLSECYSGSK